MVCWSQNTKRLILRPSERISVAHILIPIFQESHLQHSLWQRDLNHFKSTLEESTTSKAEGKVEPQIIISKINVIWWSPVENKLCFGCWCPYHAFSFAGPPALNPHKPAWTSMDKQLAVPKAFYFAMLSVIQFTGQEVMFTLLYFTNSWICSV